MVVVEGAILLVGEVEGIRVDKSYVTRSAFISLLLRRMWLAFELLTMHHRNMNFWGKEMFQWIFQWCLIADRLSVGYNDFQTRYRCIINSMNQAAQIEFHMHK